MPNPEYSNSLLPQLIFYSLWKPEPLPPKDRLCSIKLHSIGTLPNITHQLMSLPNMKMMLKNPYATGRLPTMRLLWDVNEGVIIQYHAEHGLASSDVISMQAISATSEPVFYHLYIMLYEQFSTILLDEMTHCFYTPKEFKSKVTA